MQPTDVNEPAMPTERDEQKDVKECTGNCISLLISVSLYKNHVKAHVSLVVQECYSAGARDENTTLVLAVQIHHVVLLKCARSNGQLGIKCPDAAHTLHKTGKQCNKRSENIFGIICTICFRGGNTIRFL